MRRWMIFVAILAIAGIGTAGYLGFRNGQQPANSLHAAPPTTPVTTCTVEQTVDAPGSVINTAETQLSMPATGILADVLVKPGDTVKAGHVLARMANKDQFISAVANARLELLQAQYDLEKLKQDAPAVAAQAHQDVEDAQNALDDYINNFPVTQAQAQMDLVEAQHTLTDTQAARNALDYSLANQSLIDQLEDEYQAAVLRVAAARENFEKVASRPADDPERMAALQALRQAQNNRDNLLSSLNALQGTPSVQALGEADARLAQAKAAYDEALRNWNRVKDGPDATQVALLNSRLANAQHAYEKVKDGPDALTLALAQAKVDDAQAKLDKAEGDLAAVEIKAPFAGVILSVSAAVGPVFQEGTALFTLNNPTAIEVESTITEDDYPYVNVGQPASLFFDALPDNDITGAVSRIVPVSTGGSSPLYDIYITLDNVPARLVKGMSADATISIAQKKDVLCLPRGLVQATSNGTAVVTVWANGQQEQRTIKVGLRGDTTVEIISGLNKGDLVVTQ